jgi:hypothetical protein
MLEADAVVRVCPEDSTTGIGEASEERVLRASRSDQVFAALLSPQDLHHVPPMMFRD